LFDTIIGRKTGMTFKEKKELLSRVYENFEKDVREYKQQAICKKGCTFCCTDAGWIDITTLEGQIIQEALSGGRVRSGSDHGLRQASW
jgi:hypothetical protein